MNKNLIFKYYIVMGTINDFIKELQQISPSKKELPLVIYCPNGIEVYPKIKMKIKEGTMFTPEQEVEKMVITWDD